MASRMSVLTSHADQTSGSSEFEWLSESLGCRGRWNAENLGAESVENGFSPPCQDGNSACGTPSDGGSPAFDVEELLMSISPPADFLLREELDKIEQPTTFSQEQFSMRALEKQAHPVPPTHGMVAETSENAADVCATSSGSAGPLAQPSRKRKMGAGEEDFGRGEDPAPRRGCGEVSTPKKKRRKKRREQDIVAALIKLVENKLLLDLQFTPGRKLRRIEFDPEVQAQAIDELNQCVECQENELPAAGVLRANAMEFFRYRKVIPHGRRGQHRDWGGSSVWEIETAAPAEIEAAAPFGYAAAVQRGPPPLAFLSEDVLLTSI